MPDPRLQAALPVHPAARVPPGTQDQLGQSLTIDNATKSIRRFFWLADDLFSLEKLRQRTDGAALLLSQLLSQHRLRSLSDEIKLEAINSLVRTQHRQA